MIVSSKDLERLSVLGQRVLYVREGVNSQSHRPVEPALLTNYVPDLKLAGLVLIKQGTYIQDVPYDQNGGPGTWLHYTDLRTDETPCEESSAAERRERKGESTDGG